MITIRGVGPVTDTEAVRDDLDDESLRGRRIAAVVAAVVVLAAAGVTIGVLASGGGTPFDKVPTPVLGQSLHPIDVYQRVPELPTPHPKIHSGQRELPPITGINPVVIISKPVIALHVDYARVIPSSAGSWRMNIAASEGSFFNGATVGHYSFVVVIDGKPLALFPLYELNGPAVTSADAVQYVLGGWAQWPTQADALAVAHYLTTSVTVANCTAAQIDKLRCA
jgi:hypothetical protein